MMRKMHACIHYSWDNEHTCKVTNDRINENICKNCDLYKSKNKNDLKVRYCL